VTLGRRGREPHRTPAGSEPTWQAVELEELPAQQVLAGGPARPRIGALVAIGAMGLILLAGLGFLGGRQGPKPTAPAAVATTPTARAVVEEPAVTPSTACAPVQPGVVPGVILEAGGTETPGSIELVDWLAGPSQSAIPPQPDVPTATAPIDVRADVAPVLVTTGDVCALAWQIDVTDSSGAIQIEGVDNPELDAGYAQQNRFALALWPFRGHDYLLEALLTFPNSVVRATWPIRVAEFALPVASLRAEKRSIEVSAGCDVLVSVDAGEVEPLIPCDRSVAADPAVARVGPGASLTFGFSDGWDTAVGAVSCGQLSALQFVPEADCDIPFEATDRSVTFEAAEVAGEWAVAIGGCATQQLPDAYNEVCGTWYAIVRVRR
jgi:hypothetical protein